MAPRKGMFVSNKVKPVGNFKTTAVRHEKPSSEGSSGFFCKPAKLESVSKDAFVDNKKTLKEKKPFDKKKWRMQRYSKKYKVQQWEDKRKKAVLREYYKQIDDRPKFDVNKIYEEEENRGGNDGIDEDYTVGGTDTRKISVRGNDKRQNDIRENKRSQQYKTKPVCENKQKNDGFNLKPFETLIDEDCVVEEKPIVDKEFKKNTVRKRAHEEFERIKEEKRQQKEEAIKKKAEKRDAMKKSKEERLMKFKRLSRKTKKGQPIMKDRMEFLLEQIQKNMQK